MLVTYYSLVSSRYKKVFNSKQTTEENSMKPYAAVRHRLLHL